MRNPTTLQVYLLVYNCLGNLIVENKVRNTVGDLIQKINGLKVVETKEAALIFAD